VRFRDGRRATTTRTRPKGVGEPVEEVDYGAWTVSRLRMCSAADVRKKIDNRRGPAPTEARRSGFSGYRSWTLFSSGQRWYNAAGPRLATPSRE